MTHASSFFDNYSSTHLEHLNENPEHKLRWFRKYSQKYYLPYISEISFDDPILEIGCNRGYLIKCLTSFGFSDLTGIDLSSDDLKQAALLNPTVTFIHSDATTYLEQNIGSFSLIVLKAVLEHIPKPEIPKLISALKTSLKPGGILLIDVPNMDWLFASHERYMDFTHEVGFTKESLGQLLRQQFEDVHIIPVDNIIQTSIIRRVLKPIARKIINTLLSIADLEGASSPLWCRSIIAVSIKK
jgi:SAM-dependent methyltransferase